MSDAEITQYSQVLNRSVLTRRLVELLKADEAIVAGIGNNNFDLWAAGPRPQNFYMLGSMGMAAPIALGVAVAQPSRRVFALEGDGSLLMQLGALATIAALKPANLTIVVWDNGLFQITGEQKTLTSARADLVAIAKGAGLKQAEWVADEDHFATLIGRSITEPGPWFIAVKVDNSKAAGTTERDPAKIRLNFMKGIGASA
jgi:thiamine pyrophosphate-dependent acetolactate synthase large subunit-like protein